MSSYNLPTAAITDPFLLYIMEMLEGMTAVSGKTILKGLCQHDLKTKQI